MARRDKKEKKQSSKIFRKILIVTIFLIGVLYTLKYAYNYVRNDITDKTNLIINNNNITTSLKKDLIIDNGVVFITKEDICNFFDEYIYYDEKYNHIITTSENNLGASIFFFRKFTS